ncbi:MAG TPA: diacylglycerol kinase family protein [Actinomycetota bacterium]|nr:diacylglycerol kinase family protein [Actinomycetota bacterium]
MLNAVGARLRRTGIRRLDHRVFRRFSSLQSPFLDASIVPLGRAADNSRLWIWMALALALLDGRRGRRAALRGVLSIAFTSGVVNQGIKRMAQRSRPVGEFTRSRFGRSTKTSSFPSGHAASAAAFAAGVAQELPVLGAPLGVMAAGVAASRVYAGVHYPADVVVGAASGVAVSLGLRKLWPVASRQPAKARPAYSSLDTVISSDGEGITFVVNASAGFGFTKPSADEVREALPKAEVIVVETPDDWEAALDKAAQAKVIGVAGGDGSINAAAQAAVENGQPLVIIPAGTLNHLARDLGIDSVDDAIDAIARGHAAAVDVATIDGKVFLNTASFGSYVELVDARQKLQNKIGKWPAVFVALVHVLRNSEPIEVVLDGRRRSLWMIFIGNCRYQPSGFAPSWRERLDDGLLDIRIVDGDQPWARTRLLFAVLSGTLGQCRVYEQRLAKQLRVASVDGTPLRLARDGETFEGSAQFLVKKLERPLPIYVKR